jgi:peptidyl serine alpha-galactosyltransferase
MLVNFMFYSFYRFFCVRSGQSYIFFYQIWKSGQTGNVTRIASGCREGDKDVIERIFREQVKLGIPTGSERFHLHLTPDYSKSALPGANFKFFNKPFGLRHWMEEGLNMPQSLPQYADTIFIVLDPDQYILRPFDSNNFAVTKGDASTWPWHSRRKNDVPRPGEDIVHEGNPMAQMYLFGSNWWSKVQPGLDPIVEAAHVMMQENAAFSGNIRQSSSPLYKTTHAEVERSYVAGPPYVAVGTDMYRLVAVWAAVVVPVYSLTVEHLSEMFAYSVAAIHLSLPHQLSYNFMISDPPIFDKEGWSAIDAMTPEQVCDPAWRTAPETISTTQHLPHVLHFCQRYYLGPYFFSKYRLPWNFLTCEQPLLLDPMDQNHSKAISLLYDSSTTPDGTVYALPAWERPRQAFFLCHIIGTLNDAATFWKQQHCDPNTTTINLDKVYFVPPDSKK